jgi:hypothetical protein
VPYAQIGSLDVLPMKLGKLSKKCRHDCGSPSESGTQRDLRLWAYEAVRKSCGHGCVRWYINFLEKTLAAPHFRGAARQSRALAYRFGDRPNVTDSMMLRPGTTLMLSPPVMGVGPEVLKGSV